MDAQKHLLPYNLSLRKKLASAVCPILFNEPHPQFKRNHRKQNESQAIQHNVRPKKAAATQIPWLRDFFDTFTVTLTGMSFGPPPPI